MAPETPDTIYHFVPAEYFDSTDADEDYFPIYFEEEGFIHNTVEPEWVERIANRVLADESGDVYLLEIDTTKVTAKTIMEQAKNGHWFPHIFGGLNRDAIRRKTTLRRNADGEYAFPAEWR